MCADDCLKNQCLSKSKRTCSGGKEGRSCGLAFYSNGNCFENWFRERRRIIAADYENSEYGCISISRHSDMGYRMHRILCQVCTCKEDGFSVMGFPYQERRLKVVTLGGHIREIDGVIYQCKIKDQSGKVYEFHAHGLDRVTGDLGHALGKETPFKRSMAWDKKCIEIPLTPPLR